MAEEPDKKSEETATDEPEAKRKFPMLKGPMMKYIIMGGSALGLMLIVAFATVMFLGGDQSEEATEVVSHQETKTEEKAKLPGSSEGHGGATGDRPSLETGGHGKPATTGAAESLANVAEEDLFAADDPTVIENIMENLAFLDFEPEPADLTPDADAKAVQDSIENVNWLQQEKASLEAREKDLAMRERELDKLNKEVSQKLITLEQALTARISNLAKLYDGMDQRSVAKLMANLDDSTVVLIIPRMKVKNASAVMALLPPQRAAKLSKQMITIAGEE